MSDSRMRSEESGGRVRASSPVESRLRCGRPTHSTRLLLLAQLREYISLTDPR